MKTLAVLKHFNESKKEDSSEYEISEVFEQLQNILLCFLEDRGRHMSLYALSKKCTVSEPTLRRIKNNQTKTLPNTSTIIGLLSYIYKEPEVVLLETLHTL